LNARRRSRVGLPARAGAPLAAVCLLMLLSAVLPPVHAGGGRALAAFAPGEAEAAVALPPVPRIAARAAIVIDGDTGQKLYGYAVDQRLPIASTTKLMTALVTLQHTSLAQTLTYPDYAAAADDSQIYLRPGERMSVHDLLLATMLPSADDAAEDLAYNLGHGSVARFVAMMNAEAARLGLRDTHYSTPIGLDTPDNYSSAADLVRLAAYDLQTQPWLARAVATVSTVLRTGDYPRRIVNLNDLVARYPWIDGVKTGHTNDAGYVLVASAHRDGMWLLSAVLGTPSEAERDQATLALLNYAAVAFHPLTLVRAGELVARVGVREQPELRARLLAAAGVTQVLARELTINRRVELRRPLQGPLRKGARVGRLVLSAGGSTLAAVPLVLAQRIPAVGGLTEAARFLSRPITLVAMVAVLLGLGVYLGRRERTRSGRRRVRRRARSAG
jgi:D-alanyl-D-alanine carboxypeptidase (penicillin-binding protein 5/6)